MSRDISLGMSCDKYTTCNTFMYCAMIQFLCVVNNDPEVDKYTQEGLEVNFGFSQIQWIVYLWLDYSWILFESFLNSCMHNWYSFVFLSDRLVWPTRLVYLATGEVLCNGFNLVVIYMRVTERDKTRICIVAIKGKTMGFIHIDWVYFVYIMSSCLRSYFIFHELNTQDAC